MDVVLTDKEHKSDTSKYQRRKQQINKINRIYHTTACLILLSDDIIECFSKQCNKSVSDIKPDIPQYGHVSEAIAR